MKDISLSVASGEVVGIAGVAGNGQGEFFEAISGEVLQSAPSALRIRGKDAGRLGISERRMMGPPLCRKNGSAMVPCPA